MDALSVITGAALGILLSVAVNSFLYLRRNPLLPPIDGHIVVTRRDGSQHYRKLRGTGKPDAQIDIEDIAGQPDATTAV